MNPVSLAGRIFRGLMGRLRNYGNRMATITLSGGIRTVLRRIKARWSRKIRILQAKLGKTELSDAAFLQSLELPFSQSWKSYLDHMATRSEPRFFFAGTSTEEIRMAIETGFKEHELQTIIAADRVCGHVFDLLGSGPIRLGDTIDWHTDFKTGHRFDPWVYYTDVRYAPYKVGFDIKVPWELSRAQHLVWLGQAYLLAKDERYAREFVSEVTGWIKHNPPQFGINWTCTMDVAIRAVNWIWGYYLFRQSPSLTKPFLEKLFKSLLIHGRHIRNNLEWSEWLTSNHYLSNIVALVYLGILFTEFGEAQSWREFGLRELENEMFRQVYEDGVDFEASVTYHRMVTEFFLSATILARLNGHTFSAGYMERLEKMVEFVMHLTKPDGTVPIVGDNDNGRLHRLKAWMDDPLREWYDHRYLLSIGAVLFDRKDFARSAGNEWEEALWLFGKKAYDLKVAFESTDNLPLELSSCCFRDSGFYIMRSGSWYMNINACPNGQKGNAGHAHNDSLGFELYGAGTTWIMDPGTYVYTSDYDARNLFRSSKMHSTVTVDDEEQNRVDPMILFQMKDDAHPRVLRWEETGAYSLFVGEHDGYMRLESPVMHRRAIFFDRRDEVWLIRDTFAGDGKHTYMFTLPFTPGISIGTPGFYEHRTAAVDSAMHKLHVVSLGPESSVMTVQDSSVAPGYGSKLSAPKVVFTWDTTQEFLLALAIETDAEPVDGRISRALEHMKTVYEDEIKGTYT